MYLIKVDAIDSTNSYLRKRYRENKRIGNCCVVAQEQKQGRGQRGAKWQSQKGKNLTFSLLFTDLKIDVEQQFVLNALVSLSILRVLEKTNLENLRVKWPNDIMAGNFKIGGILIENFLQNRKINACIIGIGLNVNQEKFDRLPKASSLKNKSGKTYVLDELLVNLLPEIETSVISFNLGSTARVFENYQKNLFRIKKTSTFKTPEGERFSGIIQGVGPEGKLLVLTENETLKSFENKEVELLF